MTEVAKSALAFAFVGLLTAASGASADTAKPSDDQGAKDQAPVSNPFAGREDIAVEGRTLFNIHCSHCHGPNATQGERRRDLRRLKRRYRADMPAVFLKTAWNGRPSKGMPPWKGVVPEAELWKIYTFLETVQKK